MVDINYLSTIIKILDSPETKLNKNNVQVTRFRAQLPQLRKTQLVTVVFWGSLASDISNYYKKNDYVIIEGYTSIKEKKVSKITKKPLKMVEITGLRVYPFFLASIR